MNNRKIYLLIILLCFVFTSCGIYSFSGANISPDIKTVTVNFFPNQASIIMPSLSQSFTESLKDKIISETGLSLTEGNGDIEFNGVITGYRVSPAAPTSGETAALNRLTITVKVEYLNQKEEDEKKKKWSSSFSRFADYENVVNLSDVEEQLVEEINEQLVEDIFMKAFVNW